MTGPARRERYFQQRDAGWLRPGRLRIVVASIFMAASAVPAPAAQPAAAHPDASTADALVAKLRDLPLPVHAFSPEAAPGKRPSQRLPALEARRQRVYEELHALGPASVPALARALRDPEPGMRRNVAVALDVVGGGWWLFPDGGSKLDLRPALPALLAALKDPDPGVRAWAAQDISDMGAAAAAAVPGLRALLHRPDPESRGNACRALGEIGAGARDALPDLRDARNDSSPEVRQAARDAVTRIDRALAIR